MDEDFESLDLGTLHDDVKIEPKDGGFFKNNKLKIFLAIAVIVIIAVMVWYFMSAPTEGIEPTLPPLPPQPQPPPSMHENIRNTVSKAELEKIKKATDPKLIETKKALIKDFAFLKDLGEQKIMEMEPAVAAITLNARKIYEDLLSKSDFFPLQSEVLTLTYSQSLHVPKPTPKKVTIEEPKCTLEDLDDSDSGDEEEK